MTRTPMAEVKRKQVAALSLLRAGHSYQQIANRLGYANRGSAWRLVRNALDANVSTEVDQYRTMELDRLDAVHAELWPLMVEHNVKAANALIQISDQRCRLHGLYTTPPRPTPKLVVIPPPGGYAL